MIFCYWESNGVLEGGGQEEETNVEIIWTDFRAFCLFNRYHCRVYNEQSY